MSEFRWPTVDEVLKIIDEENAKARETLTINDLRVEIFSAKNFSNAVTFAIDKMADDAERYRKLRKWVKAASDRDNGDALFFILDVDWGAIKDGDDAEMLDAAIDAEP